MAELHAQLNPKALRQQATESDAALDASSLLRHSCEAGPQRPKHRDVTDYGVMVVFRG